MNWYLKMTESAVDDFYLGYQVSQVKDFPEQESDLTNDQKQKIKDIGYSSSTTSRVRIELFKKYPNTAFVTIDDLGHYIQDKYYRGDRYNNDVKSIWSKYRLTLKNKSVSYLPETLPIEIYIDIIENLAICPLDIASEVVRMQFKYSTELKSYIYKKFPIFHKLFLANNEETVLATLLDYVKCPHSLNWNKFICAYAGIKDENLKIQVSEQLIDYQIDISNQDKRQYMPHIQPLYQEDGETIIEKLDILISHIKENKEYFGREFIYIKENTRTFNEIGFVQYGSIRFSVETLYKLYQSVKRDVNKYYKIHFHSTEASIKEYIKTNESYKIGVPQKYYKNNVGIILFTEEYGEDLYVEYIGPSAFTHTGSYYENKYEDSLYWLTQKSEKVNCNLFEDIMLDKMSKYANEDLFFQDLFKNSFFKKIISQAGSAYYGVYIYKKALASESLGDYEEKPYDTELPFSINTANNFVKLMPEYIREANSEVFSIIYVLCCGLFSSASVIKAAEKNMKTAQLLIGNIKCTDNENINNIIFEIDLKNKKKNVEQFKQKLSRFLLTDAVQIKNIEDYPSIYDSGVVQINKSYKNKNSKEYFLETLKNTKIYLIDHKKYSAYFTEEEMSYRGINPNECAGLFSKQYNFSDANDSIIVFVGENYREMDITKKIFESLGIQPEIGSGFSSVSQEATFWHEATHSILSILALDIPSPRHQTVEEWMKDPNELLAISHGNLQFIKRKLKDFFTRELSMSKDLTSGLIANIKSDIIETFSWEFQGMTKDRAYNYIESALENFEAEVYGISDKMTIEEKVDLLVDMFTEFFMKNYLSQKVHDEESQNEFKKEIDKNIILNKEKEIKYPDTYEYRTPGKRDNIIAKLEQREDYKKFFKDIQEKINEEIYKWENLPDELKKYTHRNSNGSVRVPFEFIDLLKFIYQDAQSVFSVDVKNLNKDFRDLIPASLLSDINKIVELEQSKRDKPYVEKNTPITTEDAEDLGKFLTEQDREYGKGWEWLANSHSWYKKAIDNLSQ